TTTFSALFEPLQLGSWLMSIVAGLGAVPSNVTVPMTVAAVAGSIGVAGAVVAARVDAAGWFSRGSFFLHAPGKRGQRTAASMQLVFQNVLFMSCFLLFEFRSSRKLKPYSWAWRPALLATCTVDRPPPVVTAALPIGALTRRCSSGVRAKM